MPERTIRVLYYTTKDGEVYGRGETVDFSAEEADRGDELGAFAGNQRQPGVDASATAFGTNPDVVGPGPLPADVDPEGAQARAEVETPHTVTPPVDGDLPDATVPAEMTDEEIDALAGSRLDDAVIAADIDTTTGGSLADGSLSADEKRAALKAQNAA